MAVSVFLQSTSTNLVTSSHENKPVESLTHSVVEVPSAESTARTMRGDPMGMHNARVALSTAAIVLGLGVAGCGSDGGSEATTSEQTPSTSSSPVAASTSSEAPSTSAQAGGSDQTVGEYLQGNGISQTMVKRGDANAPRLDLPMPPGWADVGADTPDDAYGAIYLESAEGTPNPPAIIARMARLSGGDVDEAKILELAPSAVRNQPGYEGPATGRPSALSGFEATEIAGTVDQDGRPMFVARKTVVISGKDAIYLLALDAQGPVDQRDALLEAMSVIDSDTTIEP